MISLTKIFILRSCILKSENNKFENKNNNFQNENNKFILGTWNLRVTNDKHINDKNGLFYMEIYEDYIKFKHIYNKGMIMEKKSITGVYNIINNNNTSDTAIIDIVLNKYNIYSHSIYGIQLPELKSANKTFISRRKVYAKKIFNTILFHDTKRPLYYLFDLQQINKIKSPFIEISINTLFFSQVISILLNLFFNDIFIKK